MTLRRPLAPSRVFLRHFARNASIALPVIAASLFLGVLGYHTLGELSWIDALLNASMILAGMGPVDVLPSDLPFDPPRIVRVDRRTDVELWSRPGLLLLIIGLLGLEWLLRQRSGYL